MIGNLNKALATRLGFIGGGKMAEALASALISRNVLPPDSIIMSDPVGDRRTVLQQQYKVKVTGQNHEVPAYAKVIVLAVKPQMMEQVLREIKSYVDTSHLVISIAAGIRIERLSRELSAARIVRVMPNTPCLVGEMAAGYAAGPAVTAEDIVIVERLLGAAGKIYKVKEELLDAVTGLSGSGPAFVAYLIDAFIKGGIQEGIPEPVARELALQTFLGTARLLSEKKLTVQELITMVSSPGGTTIAGRNILENESIQDIIIRTISAATARSKELGGK
ncbi:MAG: pyrroline-5-carboxylate reductase [Patescibacteria group bacterium]|nr:pyrroline-5-carboxylate reductase [Patescibacteria group bacterium]